MRMAAAEAYRVLVDMAAAKLGLSADALTVTDGVVHAKDDPSKKASYAELIGGRYFNVQLDWNKQWGNPLYAPGKAQPKPHTAHRIVGQPIKRFEDVRLVKGGGRYQGDVTVPNETHAVIVRSIHAATSTWCSGRSPRVVIADVPRRMPDGSNGLRGSNGTVL